MVTNSQGPSMLLCRLAFMLGRRCFLFGRPALMFTSAFFACTFFAFAFRAWLSVVLVHILHQILDDQRNPSIGRIFRTIRLAQSLVGIAADLGNLVPAYAVGLHHPTRRITASSGKLPVAVVSIAGKGLCIRVPFHRYLI